MLLPMKYPRLPEKSVIFLLLIPALVAFFIALIPTLKYQWPLSWDIYYHIHLAQLYMEHGFTLWDSLTYAPFGRPIYYPPLFHYLLATLAVVLKVDLFQISRYLQPIFAFVLVLSFTYVGKKLYNIRVGLLAGFLLFFTMIFHRAMLPLPETLASVLLPLGVYFYYRALDEDNKKYILLSGICSGLMFLTHNLTALIMVGVVLFFTLFLKLRGDKLNYKLLGAFLGVTLLIVSVWLIPLMIQYGYIFHNPQSSLLNPLSYLIIMRNTLELPVMFLALLWIFSLIINGFYKNCFRKCARSDILVISWMFFIILLSNIYLMGIPILSDRILNFAVFPAVVMAALGLEYIRSAISGKNPIYSKIYTICIVFIIIIAVISASSSAMSTKPMVNESQLDLAQWFNANGDKKSVVMSLTEGIDPVIVSISRQPVSTGGYQPGMVQMLDRRLYYNGTYSKEDLIRDKIGYFVEESPIVHQGNFTLVYQNKDYKVWRVDI